MKSFRYAQVDLNRVVTDSILNVIIAKFNYYYSVLLR